MKTQNFMKKMILASTVLFFTVFTFTSCTKSDGNGSSSSYSLSGNASGSQMVPVVAGNGSGSITGTYNPDSRILTYTTSWSNLSGAATSGQLYYAPKGVVAVSGVGEAWIFPLNSTNGGSVINQITLSPDQETQLLAGNFFYMIGTAARPNGEIRGQITVTR
jgi:hypothetical protein